MDWTTLLREGVWMGLALSGVLSVLIVGSLLWSKEMWLQDYPPDVQAKWGAISETAKKQRSVFAILFFGALIGALIYVPFRLSETLGTPPSFFAVFVCVAIIYSIFNLWDAFIIDWLLFRLFPKLVVLPGTEGMAGYSDMKFWAINLLKGIPISLMMALISAGATSLVMWVGSLL